MKKNIERVIVPSEGPDLGPLRTGLAQLSQLCVKLNTNGTLVVPAKNDLRHSVVSQALGDHIVKLLQAGKPVRLSSGHQLHLHSFTTFKKARWMLKDVILCVYPDQAMLNELDDALSTPAIVVVPHTMPEVESWRHTWNVTVLGASRLQEIRLIKDTVVQAAMEALTSRINLSTGLSHPRDKAAAVTLLRELINARIRFYPNELRAWAVRHNWRPDDADELADIAARLQAGRVVRPVHEECWADNIIDVLRERAVKDDARS